MGEQQITVPDGVKPSIQNIFKYNYVQSHVTNLSKDYVIDWSTWEMIRESIQNMMDEAQYMSEDGAWDGRVDKWEKRVGQHADDFQLADFCKVWVKDKYLNLADMGRGVDFEQIYLVGESGKRNKGFRGEKGEGEILSFLIAARLGIEKWMFSQDWAVTARFTMVNGYEILTMDEYRTLNDKSLDDRHWGTIWKYHYAPGVQKQHNKIYDMFPDLSRERIRADKAADNAADETYWKQQDAEDRRKKRELKKKNTASKKLIFVPREGTPARLFIRGIYVKDIDAIFSYNLREAGINRDRNMVNDMDILDEIQAAFNSDDFNYSMAKSFWGMLDYTNFIAERGVDTPLEFRKVLIIENETTREHIKKAFFAKYGNNACIETDIGAATDALAMKMVVVRQIHPMVRAMALAIGIPSDVWAVGGRAKGTYLDKRTLNKKEKKRLAALNMLGTQIVAGVDDSLNVPVLNVTSKFLTSMNQERKNALAIYNPTGQEIVILRKVLKGDPMGLIKTYVHELGHHVTGASDRSRVFESWFTGMTVELMANPNQLLTKIVRIILKT